MGVVKAPNCYTTNSVDSFRIGIYSSLLWCLRSLIFFANKYTHISIGWLPGLGTMTSAGVKLVMAPAEGEEEEGVEPVRALRGGRVLGTATSLVQSLKPAAALSLMTTWCLASPRMTSGVYLTLWADSWGGGRMAPLRYCKLTLSLPRSTTRADTFGHEDKKN